MQRLGRMVGSFLTLTKLRGGQGLTVATPCPINDVVMDTIQQAGSVAAQHGVRIVPQLHENGSPPIVCGDSQLLRAMLDNLLRNAIRYSPRGRRCCPRRPAGSHCEIVVRDAGPGVPDNLIGSLFDRFSERPRQTPSRRGHGSGCRWRRASPSSTAGRSRAQSGRGRMRVHDRLPLAQEPTPARPDPCVV
jgi:two-component system OmpR family sensor kinase